MNFDCERLSAMFPTAVDDDALMHATTRFGDLPHYLPTKKWKRAEDLFTGWMLLSYRKPVTSSSYLDVFAAANVTDENIRSFWVAGSNKPGEWLTVDLGRACDVRAVQVNFTDYKSGIYSNWANVYTQFKLHASTDGEKWTAIADLTNEKRDRPNAYIELREPARARFIKYEHVYVASPNLAISDVRVFGHGGGDAPRTPGKLQVRRDGNDPRNAFVSWEDVPGAVGYNILWGLTTDQGDKLYQCYQVFADQRPTLELRALNNDQNYSFAIEAFNESGVSKPGKVVRAPKP